MPAVSGAKTKSIRKVKIYGTHFDAGNRAAAEIILADEKRYEGLPVMWAKRWTDAHHIAIALQPQKP